MRLVYSFTVLLATLSFWSCSTTTPEWRGDNSGVNLPNSWASTKIARAGVDRYWIRRFKDSNLEALVDEAVRNNKNLQSAAARVERLSASSRLAAANRLPEAQAGLNASRSKQVFIGFPFGGGGVPSSISETFGSSLDVRWEIDLWGKLRSAREAAFAEAQAEAATYRAARASLVAQVAKAYFSHAEAAEQLRLSKEALVIRQKTEDAIFERFERSLAEQGGTASQVRLAQTDVASTKANVIQREQTLQQTKRQIEALLGRYPSGKLRGSLKLSQLPSKPPAGLPSELLMRRPDVLAAERRYAASGRRVKQSELMRYPSFSLTGRVGTSTGDLRDILNSDFGVWSLAGGLVQPILIDGRQKERIEIEKAKDREELAKFQQTVLSAFKEVEDALDADKFLTQRLAQTQKALNLAKDTVESAESDYSIGVGDVITLLTAIDRQISIASQLVSIKALLLSNRVDLHLALGGDYKPSSK